MEEKSDLENKSLITAIIQQWMPPGITAIIGLMAGIALSTYNSDLATNRFFLEKQAEVADNIAVQFPRYTENWVRLIRMRKNIDDLHTEPSKEQREYFKKCVIDRADSRDKLFSSLDSTHLYYSKKTSDMVVKFQEWDTQQSELTIERLPDIKEWRNWQIEILHQLRKEITK